MSLQTRALLVVSLVFTALGLIVYQNTTTPVQDPAAKPTELNRQGPMSEIGPVPSQALLTNVIGQRRPDFALPDLNGIDRQIGEWDGKVLAINFWASWCLPCLDEIPELVTLQSLYGAEGLQIIGIALQKPEGLDEFIKQHGMNYPVLTGEAAVIAVAENYGNLMGALPYTAIINRLGTIVYTRPGPVSRDKVEEIIKGLL